MKKYIFYLFMASIGHGLEAQTGGNDVFVFSYFKNNGEDGLHLAFSHDGYTWTAINQDSAVLRPTAGKDKLMRDPCIIRGADGVFHMVWTVSWNERGIGYASSPDLLHWSDQVYIPVMEYEPGTRNCWAPEIFYDPKRSDYILYWSSTIPGRFPQTEGTSEDNYNHRFYYTTTRDFKSFRKTRLLYDPGFSCIDATIAKDGKRFILIFKDERREPVKKSLRMAYSRKAAGNYRHLSEPFTESWVEGPTMIKDRGRWTVYFDRYTLHSMGAMVSEDLVNWRNISAEVYFPPGVRHGSVFKVRADEFARLVDNNK